MTQRTLIELLHGKYAHADPIACVQDVAADLAAGRLTGARIPSGRWCGT
jgi:hypothetical protein